MRVSTAKKPSSSQSTAAAAKRLPSINVGSTLSKKIDKAIVDSDTLKSKQLKFTTKLGFVSPSGNPLQVVYLSPGATKNGLNITYVDAKAKQFWAQAPGVSGLAKGPFKLPAGTGADLAKVTAREKKAETKQPKAPAVTRDIGFQNTGSDNAAIRRRLNTIGGGGGSGGVYRGGGGGGSGGGGYGGGGGGLGWGS